MTPALVLETPRLVLREFDDSDRDGVHAYASDPEVVRHLDWGPNQMEETLTFLATARSARDAVPRTTYHLAIVLKATARLIGGCRIQVRSATNQNGDLGYVLARSHWSHGYMTEAAHALVGFGFERLALHRLMATCDVENHASARVLEKVGMRREGRLRDIARRRSGWRDSYLYAILEPEWRSGHPDRMPGDRSPGATTTSG